MSASLSSVGIAVPGPSLQRRFLVLLPRIERHARIYFRHVVCPVQKADCLAETVALCWVWFLRLAERGKDASQFVSVLAAFATRAVPSGRRLCGQLNAQDALNPIAQQRHGFLMESLPISTRVEWEQLYGVVGGQRLTDSVEERLHDNTQTHDLMIPWSTSLLRPGARRVREGRGHDSCGGVPDIDVQLFLLAIDQAVYPWNGAIGKHDWKCQDSLGEAPVTVAGSAALGELHCESCDLDVGHHITTPNRNSDSSACTRFSHHASPRVARWFSSASPRFVWRYSLPRQRWSVRSCPPPQPHSSINTAWSVTVRISNKGNFGSTP